MNIRAIILFLYLISILSSCQKRKSHIEKCQTVEDLAKLAEHFEFSEFKNMDFLIYFTSNDSWGTYANTIKIYKTDFKFIAEGTQVLRNSRTSRLDTLYSGIILTIEKIDSIKDQINKLNCHSYGIGSFGASVDGNYHRMMFKNGNTIKGWGWQDGIYSWANGAKVVDSMLIEAHALEGMLYRFAGIGGAKIVYAIEHECINDSVDIAIYPMWGDFTTQYVSATHPIYKFVTNEENYASGKIKCGDSLDVFKELDIIVITKENRKVKFDRIKSIKEELDITSDAHKQGIEH